MTMDLYGHLVDDNLWEAARAIGGILGASEPPEQQDEDADDAGSGRKCLVVEGFRVEPPIGIEPMTYALRGGIRSSTAVCCRHLGLAALLLLAADPARIQARPGSLLALA